MEHFSGTEHATRTCPRRQLLENPDLGAVFELRHDLGEAPLGVDGAGSVTPAAVEALGVVDDGVAYRMKQAAEVEAREAAAKALKKEADRGR